MTELKVLAVDDDQPKLTQLLRVLGKSSGMTKELSDGIPATVFQPSEFHIKDGVAIEEVVNAILGADCAVIDYQLGSGANVSFTGVDVLNETLKRHKNFPAFLLTSHQDDVFSKEIVDVCHVFAFDRYLASPAYAREINRAILRQVCNHKRERNDWESRLLELRNKKRRTVEEDEYILELDTWIEQCSSHETNAISKRVKRDLTKPKIDELISKIDALIKTSRR
ncbi:MAG: hypothetical protein II840_12055 [Kiritimatiellae bacterium]|nr:hypothetical protein [Kiritimatiellia bacterium]